MNKRLSGQVRREKALQRIPRSGEIIWFRKRLKTWFMLNRRDFPWRSTADPYITCIAEILLQQTSAAKVANVISGFIQRFPNWDALAGCDEADIKESIHTLGLYRRRAHVLHELANVMVNLRMLPRSRTELENLPGIGQYIANVLLVVLYHKRLPFLDVNMSRVLERFFGPGEFADIRYDPYLQTLSRKVVNIKDTLSVNWMILDFAATVCRKRKPICAGCVLVEHCRYAKRRLLEIDKQ